MISKQTLTQWYRKWNRISDDWMNLSQADVRAIIQSFPVPKNRFERSFFQYKASLKQQSPWRHLIKNLACIIPLLKILFARKRPTWKQSFDALDLTILKETIPESLHLEFPNMVESSRRYLSKDDRGFFYQNIWKKHPFQWFYHYNILKRIALISYAIEAYHIRSVLSGIEYSFVSSALTEYCERKGIEHINIMHGDKLLNPRDSFVSFHRFYVWDEHYTILFESLNASATFIVEKPTFLKFDPENGNYSTYYLQKQDETKMELIKNTLVKSGFSKVAIRPHPRFSNLNDVFKIFKGYEIEDTNALSIEQSLARTKRVISVYSTVLYQGHLMGKDVIIDNVSEPERIQQLRELKYIMLSKPHQLWSEYVGEINRDES